MRHTSDVGGGSGGGDPDRHDLPGGDDPGVDADQASARRRRLLLLGALGVVYGDIGTSPLYALREAFAGPGARPEVEGDVLGVVSLILWSLVAVVSVKYVWVVMRADDHGEGGIVALASLATRNAVRGGHRSRRVVQALGAMGLFGAALLYGDGMITPAISVLSAVEGLEVLTTTLEPVVVPAAIAILVVLFAVQRGGTGRIGRVLGPIMVAWFTFLALTGAWQVVAEPRVLAALNPVLGLTWLVRGGWPAITTLGAVFLAVTGSEALYADLGHFGHRAIATGWSRIVLPALGLQYLGQGALVLGTPSAADAVFYRMVPAWALAPTVALATAATVIASQALISGAFSLTAQAVQLGYLPRMRIHHTSEEEVGQVYVPVVNTILMLAAILLVVGFGSSTRLASAYGVAVVLTMLLTTVLFFVVARDRLEWSLPRALALCGAFLLVDLVFLVANVDKVPSGGWFPLVVGGLLFLLMTTWIRGYQLTRDNAPVAAETSAQFLSRVRAAGSQVVPGTTIHLTANPDRVPPTLVANHRSNHVVHEQTVVVTVATLRRSHVDPARRVEVLHREPGLLQLLVRVGFADVPDVPAALAHVEGLDLDASPPTWVVGGDDVVSTPGSGMARWREQLYVAMRLNSSSVAHHLSLPAEHVVSIGRRIEI